MKYILNGMYSNYKYSCPTCKRLNSEKIATANSLYLNLILIYSFC